MTNQERIKSEIEMIDAALRHKHFYSPQQIRSFRVRRARINKLLKTFKKPVLKPAHEVISLNIK